MDRGAWQVTVHGVTKNRTQVSNGTKLDFGSERHAVCCVFSRSVLSGLQHARLPCPSPTPGTCSNSCPLNQWCHPTISFSVISFSSSLQSFPVSGYFSMSQLFTSGGQSIRASASVLSMNIQDWFSLVLTGWISLQSKGLSNTTVKKHQFFGCSTFLILPILTSIHDYWKNHSLTRQIFAGKAMSLLFNMMSRFVIAFFQGASIF